MAPVDGIAALLESVMVEAWLLGWKTRSAGVGREPFASSGLRNANK